jgi:hypothetical protein
MGSVILPQKINEGTIEGIGQKTASVSLAWWVAGIVADDWSAMLRQGRGRSRWLVPALIVEFADKRTYPGSCRWSSQRLFPLAGLGRETLVVVKWKELGKGPAPFVGVGRSGDADDWSALLRQGALRARRLAGANRGTGLRNHHRCR